ncbi:MAG: PQQ-binding-like beta-propeller repeat protein [Planctomycetes bacterium]|nr:PQQ-binding-like beta-propeller repeat protein [Planctomycetota bacterium]
MTYSKTSRPRLWTIKVCSLVVLLALLSAEAHADDWPGWLGPQRDGVWRETGIVDSFPAEGPRVVWRKKIGTGYAGPAVAQGRVYVADRLAQGSDPTAEQTDNYALRKGGGVERVLCLRETDGEILWTHSYDCPYNIAYPAGPRATPTVDGDRVYTAGAQGDLFCLDAANGDVVWYCDFKQAYKLKIPTWGACAPPLVDGDKLICIVGGDGSTAVAFNKETGEEIWRSLSSKDPGYSAPIIYTVGQIRQLIIWHGESINSMDPETGKPYWSIPMKTWSGMAIATPRLLDHSLFVMGFRHNSTMIALDPEKPVARVLWRGSKTLGVAGTLNTPFLQEGHIYASGDDGVYRCVNMQTGQRLWETSKPTTQAKTHIWANAFTVKNGERFFLANDLGDLIIATLTVDGYREIDRCHLLEPTGKAGGRKMVWSHPAFANKRIYARNDKEIICVSLASQE